MKFDNNTIIKGNIDNGLKFIKGIDKYDLLVIDDIDLLFKYKDEIDELLNYSYGLILYTKEPFIVDRLSGSKAKLLFDKNIGDKYLYFYGNKNIANNYYTDRLKQINNDLFKSCVIEEHKKEEVSKINLFNKNSVLNYNINRLISKGYHSKSIINVLDLTRYEELSHILITNDLCKMTVIGNDKLKLRTTCAIYGKKLSLIEII